MTKTLIALAALGMGALIALPVPSNADERRPAGIHNHEAVEVSARHRGYRHRHVHRYWGPRYYGYRYYRPYDAYAYYPYHYRYRRGPHVHVGPGGFSFGF
jgi:hypothetical protein